MSGRANSDDRLRDFRVTPDSLASGARFADRWRWEDDVQQEWVDQIKDDWPGVWSVIQAAREASGNDMAAFLCWLGVRLMEMHRILRENGSLYLHIDHTAHAYAKTLMDGIFGWKNFRNDVVWERIRAGKQSQHLSKSFGRNTDNILFYAKSAKTTFTPLRPLTKSERRDKFPLKDEDGRPYYDDSSHIFRPIGLGARPNLCYEWRGFKNPQPSGWTLSKKRLEEEYEKGSFVILRGGKLQRRKYEDDHLGIKQSNLWNDIRNAPKKERTGYPTQKPLALYERIIRASSNPGDMVLDPFAGCATTCVAAERLGRQWVGIDINEEAEAIVLDRLKREVDSALNWGRKVSMLKDPPTRTDNGEEAAPELTLVSLRPQAPRLTARQLRGQLIEADGKICQGCGWVPHHEEYLEADHRIPKSRDGGDEIRNRVLLCSPCNSAKGNRLSLAELRLRRIEQGRMFDKSWDMDWYERQGKF